MSSPQSSYNLVLCLQIPLWRKPWPFPVKFPDRTYNNLYVLLVFKFRLLNANKSILIFYFQAISKSAWKYRTIKTVCKCLPECWIYVQATSKYLREKRIELIWIITVGFFLWRIICPICNIIYISIYGNLLYFHVYKWVII